MTFFFVCFNHVCCIYFQITIKRVFAYVQNMVLPTILTIDFMTPTQCSHFNLLSWCHEVNGQNDRKYHILHISSDTVNPTP